MAIFKLNERMGFMGEVAENLLNDKGRAEFYYRFYWGCNLAKNITHDILDIVEKRLAEFIQKDKYRK